jgi:hemolysin III
MSVEEIALPNYKLRHELRNSISHGIGAIFGIVALVLMMLKINGVYPYNPAVVHDADFVFQIVCSSIYAFGIISCMTISCLYHALARNNGKRVFRVIDHDFVFVLVGCTYTIFCLCAIRDEPCWGGLIPHSGWIIFALAWALIALGITMNSINIQKYNVLSMLIYVGVGWSIILASDALINTVGWGGFGFLLGGGIAFTIGAVLYGIGSKKSVWWHTVFHFFVLAGIVLQFIGVYFFVL